jgi:hypothetical protein
MERAPRAKAFGIGTLVAVAAIAVAAWAWWRALPSAAEVARTRTYVCAETGKPFEVKLEIGGTNPKPSPHSGKNTGFPAELCYWTKDGKPKPDPTAVLMGHWVGKPGPTFCPDCDRLVVGHNPRATPDRKPPPTRAEFAAGTSAGSAPERY